MDIKRRDFLRGLAAAPAASSLVRPLPPPAASGIEHVVVVMMENRSFDHLLGWLPTADGRQKGLAYLGKDGLLHWTHPLAPNFVGCGHPDPDHSYLGGRIQYNRGAMNGFLFSGDDDYALGYYVEADRPFFNALVRCYTTMDRSFCSILGPTFPNRFFLHAAQTDRLSNTFTVSTLPTIWDRLEQEGISHAYYFSNLPFVALWGVKYLSMSRSYSQFLLDAALGSLPAVSFVDPTLTLLDDGTGNDDHPHADIRSGDAFLAKTFHAVASGPKWSSTVFIVTYDEWGGFFDHVRPPRAAAPNGVDPDLVAGQSLLGLRIPTVVASPWTRGSILLPRVNHGVFDHTSILKLIEWRWSLAPLTARDASADVGNLAHVLDFDRPRPRVPPLPMPPAPPLTNCGASASVESLAAPAAEAQDGTWLGLLRSPLLDGWGIR